MRRTFRPATLILLVAITSALISGSKGPKGYPRSHAKVTAVVHAHLLHRWAAEDAAIWRFQPGGPWIDRVKIPAGKHVSAHTHPQDELVTVIDGIWYVGVGDKYDPAKLKAYPPGSFVLIPSGLPHFVAAKETAVIVQLSGAEK